MARLACTSNVTNQTGLKPCEADGRTVAEVLSSVSGRFPKLRSYILDDQGEVRKHITIFVGSTAITDRVRLSDPVEGDAEVFIAQALSGG